MLRRRRTFAGSPDKLLWLGLMGRNSNRPVSEWLEIEDKTVALDLELAVTYRLLQFDVECRKTQAKLIANEVGKLFGGEQEEESAEVW